MAGLALLASGCDGKSGGKHGMSDAKAVAMVEAAQKKLPPLMPITLQSLAADIAQTAGSQGAQCAFTTPAAVDGPTFLAGPVRGEIKVDDALLVVSADSGSIEVLPGLHQQYDGKLYSVEIARDAENPGNKPPPGQVPAKITVRDRYERPVFFAVGRVDCAGVKPQPAA